MIKASPNNPPKLCKSRLVLNSANRLFQSVQKKQKATIQNGKPFSGSSALKICTDAVKSVSKITALVTFLSVVNSFENQPSSLIKLARKNRISKIDEKIKQISSGLRKIK